MAEDSAVKEARERFDCCWSAMSENHKRMLEDLRFSNPADPQQWDRGALRDRGSRPSLVFDQSNQYIAQVVNDARQNKPTMRVRPVDDLADVKAAKAINGLLYHIQDVSRADIAYDTALESAARVGLGWMRVSTEVIDEETNEQEIRIRRVPQFDSVVIDDGATEPDGSDAMDGFALTTMSKGAFGKKYKDAKILSFDEGGWFADESVRIAEYFKVVEKLRNFITIQDPMTGQQMDLEEEDYWALAKQMGRPPQVVKQWTDMGRSVKWTKMSGAEVLEETDFPASHIPLIPVIGNEMWIEGKRFLCGMVRKGMDAQRAYNYARSKEIEVVALQADVVPTIAAEAIEGYEGDWAHEDPAPRAYRRWNHLGSDNNPIPQPQPGVAPNYPVAFAQLTQSARDDLQAAFGMYKSNLGAPSNAVSGRAKMQDQREGDTANFHFLDNMTRSIRHMGSIVVEMIPKIYDTKRVARILGLDGTPSQVIIDPNAPQAYQQDQKGQITINPSVGEYDVAVSTGPAYATLRQEAAEQMGQLFQANPNVFAILGDLYVKHQDWPYADEAAARLKAMVPPQALQAGEDDDQDPQVKVMQQHLQQLTQQLQQVTQAAQQMEGKLKEKADNESQSLRIEAYKAETDRLKVVPSAAILQPIILQTLQTILGQATPLANPQQAPMPQMGMGPPMQPPGGPPVAQAAEPPMQPQQGPQGPFSLPAGPSGPVQ